MVGRWSCGQAKSVIHDISPICLCVGGLGGSFRKIKNRKIEVMLVKPKSFQAECPSLPGWWSGSTMLKIGVIPLFGSTDLILMPR